MIRPHSVNSSEFNIFALLVYLHIFFNASRAYVVYNTHPNTLVTYFTTVFTPSVTVKTCLLKPDRGPCRADIEMYFFDPATKSCSTFTWGGCQGNGNRFDTLEECTNYCLTRETDPRKAPRYCSLTFDYGYCFGSEPRWYFDRQFQVCKKTIYSGCGGNKNNFYNEERCDDICRFRNTIFTTLSTTRNTANIKKRIVVINPHDTTTARTNYYITWPKTRRTHKGEITFTMDPRNYTTMRTGKTDGSKISELQTNKQNKQRFITQPDSPDKERRLLRQMLPFHMPVKLYNPGTPDKRTTVALDLT